MADGHVPPPTPTLTPECAIPITLYVARMFGLGISYMILNINWSHLPWQVSSEDYDTSVCDLIDSHPPPLQLSMKYNLPNLCAILTKGDSASVLNEYASAKNGHHNSVCKWESPCGMHFHIIYAHA